MRIHLLRSPSGGGRRSRARSERLVAELVAGGHEIADLTGDSATQSSSNLRTALSAGAIERVLVAGGDGLVHLAIQELAESNIPVAIAPVGTGNDFASALGLGTIDSTIVVSKPSAVDLIRVTSTEQDSWVASIAIAGFPASINDRANRMNLPLGSQIYTVAAALELPGFQRKLLSLEIDGETVETDTAMLAIGNTKLFGGGMLACPDARPDDGLLHLTSIQGVGRLGILRHLAGRRGGTADRPEVLRRTGGHIRLHTSAVAVWGDGEPVGVGPLELTIAPGALLLAGANPT